MLICKICGHEAENSLQTHLNNKHDIKNKQYQDVYPDAKIYSEAYSARLIYTNANRDPQYKKKLSKNTKRLYKDLEWVKKHNEALKKAQNTPEAKDNHKKGALKFFRNRSKEQIATHKKNIINSWSDPQKRNNRVTALKKAHNRQEIRENHSQATKKNWGSLSPEEKQKRNQNLKEVWAQPENRKKILKTSKIGLKAAMSLKGRENFYKAQRSPELREKRRKIAQKRILNQPVISSLNIKFKKALNDEGLFPLPEHSVGPYVVDFCFPEKRVVIEVDGDFWHANPSLYSYDKLYPIQQKTVYKDKREVTYCKNHHWVLLRFWEKEINKDISACIKHIQDIIYG